MFALQIVSGVKLAKWIPSIVAYFRNLPRYRLLTELTERRCESHQIRVI